MYKLKLTNTSPKVLVQNSVFISYPIKGNTESSKRNKILKFKLLEINATTYLIYSDISNQFMFGEDLK